MPANNDVGRATKLETTKPTDFITYVVEKYLLNGHTFGAMQVLRGAMLETGCSSTNDAKGRSCDGGGVGGDGVTEGVFRELTDRGLGGLLVAASIAARIDTRGFATLTAADRDNNDDGGESQSVLLVDSQFTGPENDGTLLHQQRLRGNATSSTQHTQSAVALLRPEELYHALTIVQQQPSVSPVVQHVASTWRSALVEGLMEQELRAAVTASLPPPSSSSVDGMVAEVLATDPLDGLTRNIEVDLSKMVQDLRRASLGDKRSRDDAAELSLPPSQPTRRQHNDDIVAGRASIGDVPADSDWWSPSTTQPQPGGSLEAQLSHNTSTVPLAVQILQRMPCLPGTTFRRSGTTLDEVGYLTSVPAEPTHANGPQVTTERQRPVLPDNTLAFDYAADSDSSSGITTPTASQARRRQTGGGGPNSSVSSVTRPDGSRRRFAFSPAEDACILEGVRRFHAASRFTDIFNSCKDVWQPGRTPAALYDHWRAKLRSQLMGAPL